MTSSINNNFLLLQINDALFPIGGYSHSYGLETYIQKNLVKNADDAGRFIKSRLLLGFCYNEFLSARLAWEYAARSQTEKAAVLEDILTASRIPMETRKAACKLGSRFVKTVQSMDVPLKTGAFDEYLALRTGKPVSHSVVYGVFCAAAGIDLEKAMEAYLYSQASQMVTNCVKTIPLSQTAGQKLLFECQETFQEILSLLGTLTEDDLCQSTPGFDIRCMQHEELYSRLYMS